MACYWLKVSGEPLKQMLVVLWCHAGRHLSFSSQSTIDLVSTSFLYCTLFSKTVLNSLVTWSIRTRPLLHYSCFHRCIIRDILAKFLKPMLPLSTTSPSNLTFPFSFGDVITGPIWIYYKILHYGTVFVRTSTQCTEIIWQHPLYW